MKNRMVLSLILCFFLIGVAAAEDKPETQYQTDEIAVYLQEGKTLSDIQELNAKYGVITTEQPFQPYIERIEQAEYKQEDEKEPPAEEHSRWYWQTEKDSGEYDKYQKKISKKDKGETKEISKTITVEEKTPPKDTGTSLFENIYTLKVPPETDITLMLQEYNSHPAVIKAIPGTAAITIPETDLGN